MNLKKLLRSFRIFERKLSEVSEPSVSLARDSFNSALLNKDNVQPDVVQSTDKIPFIERELLLNEASRKSLTTNKPESIDGSIAIKLREVYTIYRKCQMIAREITDTDLKLQELLHDDE